MNAVKQLYFLLYSVYFLSLSVYSHILSRWCSGNFLMDCFISLFHTVLPISTQYNNDVWNSADTCSSKQKIKNTFFKGFYKNSDLSECGYFFVADVQYRFNSNRNWTLMCFSVLLYRERQTETKYIFTLITNSSISLSQTVNVIYFYAVLWLMSSLRVCFCVCFLF